MLNSDWLPTRVWFRAKFGFFLNVLNRVFSAQSIKEGYSSAQCIKIGYNSAQCINLGYNSAQCIKIGYSSAQCINIGYNSAQCIKIGYSSVQCFKVGFSSVQCIKIWNRVFLALCDNFRFFFRIYVHLCPPGIINLPPDKFYAAAGFFFRRLPPVRLRLPFADAPL